MQDMDKVATINRGETTYVERNWRQSAGGRVLTFDMMLEMTESPNVAALGRDSKVVFDNRRYVVINKEVLRRSSPDLVRLVLSEADYVLESKHLRGGRRQSPASVSRH